ncbi:MAG TPA: hypothetical protein VGX23_28080 [Actinocrinis sp.]|nr:hypothetical protein [Actinocrinis sp.]
MLPLARQSTPPGRRVRIPAAILITLAMVFGAALTVLNAASGAGAATANSPLLFGENLDLYPGTTSSDWFLSQPAVRTGLVNAHVQIIRLPARGSSPSTAGLANWAELQAALQDIKAMNVAPLIILRNPQDPSLQTDDAQVVDYVNSLFGGSQVYYEWANETDLPHSPGYVSAATYLASWNANVPQLKALANPGAQFIGPVNYQYDASYLQTFLAGANPLPDAISWHTYTCNDTNDSEATCLANIDNWTSDFTAARTLMTNTIGKQLPIWDTEWNYTPAIDKSKTKYTDTAFLEQWTTKALQTLAADGVASSMHFNVQDSLPLVHSDGSLGPEGVAFSAEYNALVGAGSSPTPSVSASPSSSPGSSPSASASASTSPSPSASASTTPTGGAPKYSFEDGTLDGWSSSGHVTSLVNSTDVSGQDRTHELEAVYHATGSGDFPTIHVNPASGPSAGQTLTAYVYVPSSTTTTIIAKLYYQEPSYSQIAGDNTVISQRDAWVKLSLPVSGFSGNALQVGIQFQESPYNTNSTVYVDSVDWS